MQQSFLLDTCAALWVTAGAISQSTSDALTEARNNGLPIFVSPITAWEIAMMARKGRFRSPYTPQRWFDALLATPGTALADMPPKVLIDSQLLPGNLNFDPADRIIAATAREYAYTVMTRDRALLAYAREGHLSAFEC